MGNNLFIKKFICFFCLLLFFENCKNNNIKTDYYFSKNFMGEVAIIYNFKNANEQIFENGRLQLNVPKSGIVFTNAPYTVGNSDSRFFRKNDKNGYDEINRYFDQKDTSSGKMYIFFERIASIGCDTGSKHFNVVFFNLGERMDLEENRFKFEQSVSDILCKENQN